MTPHDAQPHADEVGCPDDGHGQAPPRLSASSGQIRRAVDHILGKCACGPIFKRSAAPREDDDA